MRWLRWGLVVVLLTAALTLAASAAIAGEGSNCEYVVSMAIPSATFVGEATAKHGDDVTFRVDELVPDHLTPAGDVTGLTAPQVVAKGQTVTVHYLGGQQYVHAGQAYQVVAWGSSADDLVSHVHTSTDCPDTGPATVNADGTPINTGIFTLDHLRPFAPRVLVGLVVVAVAAVVIRRRHRTKHPKRTITGELISR